ncbi:DNA-binding protein [Methanolobus sp. ZRKC3]|uniref:RPA family protein n=1 Tax=Methanolobus sp. ZRKC3 TaxID=3125786 RepID=UPI003254C088
MVEREIAYRVFAKEFNDSHFHLNIGSDHPEHSDSMNSPNFLVTPTGAKVNRAFVVGVITEVEDMGSQKGGENELWRARISDPTGSFTIYAGNYQPEALVFLSNVEVPSYVMIVGKVRSYEPEDGEVFVSMRPEEINYADEGLRNRWVVDTAELTLQRMDLFDEALELDVEGKILLDDLKGKDVSLHLAEGICLALEYYHTDSSYLENLKREMKNALLSIKDEISSKSDMSLDDESVLLEMMENIGNGNAIEYSTLLDEASSKGMSADQVDLNVRSLLSKGHIYEPRAGVFKVIN